MCLLALEMTLLFQNYVSYPSSEVEMIWAKLQIPNSKPLCMCSFYRPPNNNVTPIAMLNNFLSDLSQNESPQMPQIFLARDLNLPNITWLDGTGLISPNPTYGIDVNQSLLETINEFGLDQVVTDPTRGENILDLVFSSHLESVSNVEVIPGISDHEAVYCELHLDNKPESDDIEHPIFLYDWGNMSQLKTNMSEF